MTKIRLKESVDTLTRLNKSMKDNFRMDWLMVMVDTFTPVAIITLECGKTIRNSVKVNLFMLMVSVKMVSTMVIISFQSDFKLN